MALPPTPPAAGLLNPGPVLANAAPARFVERALARGEGVLTETGALAVMTGEPTGRSPNDRFLVARPSVRDAVDWGAVNRPLEPASFERLHDRVLAYLQGRELFVCDAWAGADPRHRLAVRVAADSAWHAHFSQCLLRTPTPAELSSFAPQLTVLVATGMRADPTRDGTRSGVFVVLDLERGIVLVGGTHYAGEIKKSVFAVLNYLLPTRGVFPMHCAANVGADGATALFFGLSGTGKTTLSADPERRLIGDDEHGWSDDGIFNFEGGCYAKCIRLSRAGEPQIYDALRFGSVIENVVVDPVTRRPDYDDESVTENTRAAYPISHIANAEPSGRGGHPEHIVFLTCDAFGVLPPLARLTPEQAMYHFLSGYTAKVGGTEAGVTQPEATFSTCFAAPFLPLPAARYAVLLEERLRKHGSTVWLVNTGWSGGPAGKASRIKLNHTRAMVRAALDGQLADMAFAADPVFGVAVPMACPGVPAEVLRPRAAWADSADYDRAAAALAERYRKNFEKYAPDVPDAVRRAGPLA